MPRAGEPGRKPRRARRRWLLGAIVTLATVGAVVALAQAAVAPPPPLTAVEGKQFSAVLATAGCTLSSAGPINWGDGTGSTSTASGSNLTGTHTYAEEGTFHGTVSWTDDCGPESSGFTVVVSDAPLSAAGTSLSATTAVPLNGVVVATFTDADPGGLVSDYSATIAWGDGTTSAGAVSAGASQFLVSGSHTYASAGSYNTTVSIVDAGGAFTAADGTASVSNLPVPTVTGVSPASGPAGGGTSVTITGTNLDGATAVSFGAKAATSFTANSSTQITAISPAGSGTVDVTVTAPGGTSAITSADGFGYTSAPSLVLANRPTVTSGTGAGFSGVVNPEGLLTSVHFQFGLDARYGVAGDGVVYDQSTPSQQVGSDFSNHAVSASVSGLVPNAEYHMRLVAANSRGTTFGPDQTFTTTKGPPPPPPRNGRTVDVSPVSGVVLVKLHGQKQFTPLTEGEQIPVGTTVDVTHGRVTLESAKGGKGGLNTAEFYGGAFVVGQHRGQSLTRLKLTGGNFASCRSSHASDVGGPVAQAARRRPKRHLWGSGHGSFSTTGNSASATVRGTIWLTQDDCEGTLVRVRRGVVTVVDFIRHKTIFVHAGHSYFAAKR